MNNVIGLKFLLQGGAFLQVAATSKEATEIVRKWQNNEYDSDEIIGGKNPMVGRQDEVWSLLVSTIVGVHTFLIEPAPQAPPPRSPWAGSGLG